MLRPGLAGRTYPLAFYEENGVRCFDFRPLVRAIVRDRDNGIPLSAIARGFHDALCEMALDQCQTLNLSLIHIYRCSLLPASRRGAGPHNRRASARAARAL